MTGKEVKIWLVTNDYNQETLADKLKITTRTMNSYCNGNAPYWLHYALIGIEVLDKAKKET